MLYPDPNAVLTFLTSLLGRLSRTDAPDAYVLLLSSLAHAKLLYGDMEGTRVDMDESAKILEELDGVETSVHAAYYGVAADYYKVSQSPSSFLVWYWSCSVADGEMCVCCMHAYNRRKRTMCRTTRTRCCTLRAWIPRRT